MRYICLSVFYLAGKQSVPDTDESNNSFFCNPNGMDTITLQCNHVMQNIPRLSVIPNQFKVNYVMLFYEKTMIVCFTYILRYASLS